jgi:hypothetical protein
MSSFDSSRPLLAGPAEAEDSAETWKRFVTATLMAAAALLLCAVIVVILAPLLPHLDTVSHAAGLNLSPVETHAHA